MPQNPKNKERGEQEEAPLEGVVSVTSRGVGYVTLPNHEEDVEIPPERLNTALDRDTVSLRLLPRERGRRQQGEVVRIEKRARDIFVGLLERQNGAYLLHPDAKRMYTDFEVNDVPEGTQEGVKALVRFENWNDTSSLPQTSLIKILGPAGEHETEMQAIVVARGFDTGFPTAVEEEAQEIAARKQELLEEGARERRDMRETTTFTIDPADAKDFDDALSYRKLENGEVEVGIHIADVTHYVRLGSAMDREAQERGTSIYLVDRTIPMLPEVISNDVCSMNPNEDRLAFSAVFVLDRSGAVKDRWFGKSVIHSDRRFTYEEAQSALESGEGDYAKELAELDHIAKALRQKRLDSGAIDFDQDEVKFVLDERGKPVDIVRKERLDANMLIEDFMLLANREVATYVYELCKDAPARNRTFIYRIHDVPKPERIEELGVFLRAIGYEFDVDGGVVNAKQLNRLFEEIDGTEEEELIKTASIRSMAKAVYSTKNIGHFGLSFRYYTHFTSPIRRYPDMMVHRILASHLNGTPLSKEELDRYERLAIQSSEREASAVEAERESIKYKQVEYMSEHVGETFEATISGVTEYGIFVEERETKAEGLVRVSSMRDDYYTYDKERYQLVGSRTKNKLRLGDPVRVKLTGANIEDKQLDFALVR